MNILKIADTIWALLFLFGGIIVGFLWANEHNKTEMDYLSSELEHQSLVVIKQSGIIERQNQDLMKKILMVQKAVEIIKEKQEEIESLKRRLNFAKETLDEDTQIIAQTSDMD